MSAITKLPAVITDKNVLNFESLVNMISRVHEQLAAEATKAVNIYLTLRNWLIGYYIREYELKGSDRAKYGERLFEKLAERLKTRGLNRAEARELRRFRQFYLAYPQIREALPPELVKKLTLKHIQIRESPTPKSFVHARDLFNRLSFTHFAELIQIEDPLKRAFYEAECVRGNWSVRELQRQIASLYFERSGLSRNKKKLAALARAGAESQAPAQVIRDPYVFEFLGLKPKEVVSESALEDSLLDKLQDFLLELGRGFCFEARQKRIIIGDEYFFVDLVFYHRLLRCHVLIELKVDRFRHEYLGQLNTYINWFRVHETAQGDNPPIGILLCTQKNHALVEYALAGLDNALFVSKYQLELPKKEEIQKFLEEQLKSERTEPARLSAKKEERAEKK